MNKNFSILTSTTSNPLLVPLDTTSSLTDNSLPAGSGSGSNGNLLNNKNNRRQSEQQNTINNSHQHTTSTINIYKSSLHRFYYISVKLLFRWLLLLWLLGGIVIYILNGIHFTHPKVRLFALPANVIYYVAICNHIALVGSVYFDIGLVLVCGTIFQCALMVAVPALIVAVVPSLLTYGYLLLCIVMLLCYGVLYMRNNVLETNNNNNNNNQTLMRRFNNSRYYGGGGYVTEMSSGGQNKTSSPQMNSVPHQNIAPESSTAISYSRPQQHQLSNSNNRHFLVSPMSLTHPRGSCQF